MSDHSPFDRYWLTEKGEEALTDSHITFTVTREQYDSMLRFMESLTVKEEPVYTYTPLEPWEGALLLDGGAQQQRQVLPENLMSYVLSQLKKSGYEICRRDPL